MRFMPAIAVAAALSVGLFAQEAQVSETARLQKMTARFAPTSIRADLSRLSAADKRVLTRLVEASKVLDALFLRQVWVGNEAMLLDLARDTTPEGRARLHYFLVNKGPWSRLDHDEVFVPGAPAKPAGANFYPDGATKADLERWMQSLPEADRVKATGFFTTVRRSGGGFSIVPYNVEYQAELLRAAALLREAAALAAEPTLKTFLTKRADALLSNDYYDSDVAWMELKGNIEPTFGPYEVYEDELFNYKAGFEAFITVRDEAESAKLQKFSGLLQDVEDHLPIDPKHRNPRLGALAPIVVVNEIFAAGDANRGVQTAAYNLPNDERVTREKGAKRVMLKNVQDAKFAKTLVPISKVVLSAADQKDLSFDAFFTEIVVHELMHGLGPHNITVGGRQTTVRQAMKEASSFLEEAKADISGLFAIQYLDRQERAAQVARTASVHDVSGVGVPVHSLRYQRSTRPRRSRAAELSARPGWIRGSCRRHVRGRSGEDQGRRGRVDARDHDDSGRGRLRKGRRAPRPARGGAAGREAGARSARRRAGGHRAALHDGRRTRRGRPDRRAGPGDPLGLACG